MNILWALITNYYFLSFSIAWIIAVLIKMGFRAWISNKRLDIIDGFNNGGMPSSHSTVVAAITMAVYNIRGFSPEFFVSLVFALIIISDAFMLRRSVGIMGDKLNVLLKRSKEKPMDVVYGHTFFQALMGILLGIVVSELLYIIMF